jgi:tagatose 1,6-diphosphate aldolase
VLLWYRPDADPSVCRHQEEFMERVGRACAKNDICFVLELLSYPLAADAQLPKDGDPVARHAKRVIDSAKVFADPRFGVDLFNFESPVPHALLPDPTSATAAEAKRAQSIFNSLASVVPVPWMLMSAGANMAEFRRALHYGYRAGASGYLCGRAIWLEACQSFPNMAEMDRRLRENAAAYMDEINRLTEAQARPWTEVAA